MLKIACCSSDVNLVISWLACLLASSILYGVFTVSMGKSH